MKLFDGIKDFFFAADDDDFEADVPVRHERERGGFQPSDQEDAPVNEGAPSGLGGGRRNKVVNIQTTAQLQVVLVKPSAFTDAKQIADHLIAKKTVVLNLETASPENKRRIIDFLVGVAYANGGNIRKVAVSTFIIVANNIDVMGELMLDEFDEGKLYF